MEGTHMSKLNVVRRCYNCGAILQGTDPKKEGYLDPELLETSESTVLFCEKCWSQQKFNIAPKEPSIDPQFLDMLKDARASDALIVYVVDLFSFENSFNSEVTEIIEDLNILVIANKRDLLPSKAKDSDLKEYVAHRFRVARLPLQSEDVVLVSLTSSINAKPIVDEIERRRRRHDVYIIGAMGAGKTQLLSSFLKNYSNSSRFNITTTNYPGTSIRVLQIPIDGSASLYDTPGTSTENSVVSKIDTVTARCVIPDREIKGRKITLEQGESIFIGGLARIDLIKGEKQNITGYFSNDVTLKRVVKNPDAAFWKSFEKENVAPISKTLNEPTDFDAFEISVEEKGSRDIGIAGLGWINFEGNSQVWRVFVPKGVSIYTTRAKIK